MADNTIAQVVQAVPDYPISLTNVGGATGAIIAASLGFAYVWARFRRDNAENGAGTKLYDNLSDQLEKLTKRLDDVENERDEWQKRAVDLESKIKHLEKLEAENTKLIARLDMKDQMIDEIQRQLGSKENQLAIMLQESSLKNATIQNLTDRVHDLELRLERQLKVDCNSCEFKRG